VTGKGDPEKVDSLRVTHGALPALGVSPVPGRPFNESDELPASPDTVLLSYGYWRHQFGGDRSILGRSIRVDGIPEKSS
jgi:hypothetical protein